MTDSWWLLTAAWIAAVAILLHVGAHVALIGRLKRKHPYQWAGIGEPTPFTSMSLPRFQPARDFLASGAYRELADRQLERMVELKRLSLRAAVVIYAAVIVVRLIIRHA